MAQKQPVGMAVAKYDYQSNDLRELNISKGEKLTLLDDSQHWWQVMNSKGETGFVPSNFCKKSKQGIFSSLRNTLGRKKNKESSHPVSCGASSVGTAPSSAGDRRSLTASPKNVNPNLIASERINNGNIVAPNRTRAHDNSIGQIGSPNPFYPMGSLDSNGSNKQSSTGLPKTTQSMSYNAGQQLPLSMDKHNQSQPNLPEQRRHYPVSKIPSNDPQSNNTSMQPSNGRDYVGGHKSKNPLSNCMGDSSLIDQDRPRQEPRHIGSSFHTDISYPSNTGSLGPSAACDAKFSYTPCQPDELALSRGDKIKVLEKSSDGWWRGELINSTSVLSTGWFPSNYVTLDKPLNNPGLRSATDSLGRSLQSQSDVVSSQHHSSMPSVTSGMAPRSNYHHNNIINNNPLWSAANKVQSQQRYSTVLTLYSFSKNQSEEMSFDANEILEVIERPIDDPDWWRCRNVNGEVGLVPRNYVKQLSSSEALLNKQQLSVVLPMPSQIHDQKLYTPSNSDCDHLRLSYNKSGRLKEKMWYWGNISRMECESLLITHGYLGQFVVRDSESHPGDLTVTMHAGGKCRNFKIHIQDGEYHIGQKLFSSIETLIQHYRTHPIYKSDNERLLLSDPFQYDTPSSNF